MALPLRGHERAARANGGAGGQVLDRVVVRQGIPRDDLEIAQGGAVIQLEEREAFRIAPRAHPTLHLHRVGGRRALQGILH